MFIEILDIIRSWNGVGQFLFVICIASLGTMIMLAVSGIIGEFINNTIPVLLRGYPPKNESEDGDN